MRVAFAEYRRAVRCERRSRLGPLGRCRRPLLGQCQYCAQGFCDAHGNRLDDGQEICTGKRCEQKRLDVAAHLVFKAEAAERNAAGACGLPNCSAAPSVDCDRCGLKFCAPHASQVMTSVVRGAEREAEVLTLCRHCRERLALWQDD